jgi:hypothetical protein
MFYCEASRAQRVDNARMYDPALGRFTSADTIIPPGLQGLDRYAYVNNAPVMYVDPSGHCSVNKGSFDGAYDCTAKDINSATMKQRQGWFAGLISTTGRPEWFSNIMGILDAFVEGELGESDSWISWVDAGILESIQNGYALFKSGAVSDGSSDPDMAWLEFFSAETQDDMKMKWGIAEKAGTTYGIALAAQNNAQINEREKLFLYVGDTFYRDLLAADEMESFYGQLAADVGAVTCPPVFPGFCGLWVNEWQNAGIVTGGWFGDPRSKDPVLGKAPVYYLARLILGNSK